MKVLLSIFSRVLHDKSADFPAKNARCGCISSYVIQPTDRSPDQTEECRMPPWLKIPELRNWTGLGLNKDVELPIFREIQTQSAILFVKA